MKLHSWVERDFRCFPLFSVLASPTRNFSTKFNWDNCCSLCGARQILNERVNCEVIFMIGKENIFKRRNLPLQKVFPAWRKAWNFSMKIFSQFTSRRVISSLWIPQKLRLEDANCRRRISTQLSAGCSKNSRDQSRFNKSSTRLHQIIWSICFCLVHA